MSARDEVLARVRSALGPGGVVPEVPRAYSVAGTASPAGDAAVVARFCERAAEYKATVKRVRAEERDAAIAAACAEHGAQRIAAPPGLAADSQAAGGDDLSPLAPSVSAAHGLELVPDLPPLSARDLDALDGVLTGCALAIAETGTIVLDGGERSGRRALTLVPDFHVCVVEAAQIRASVPDAIAALAPAAAEGLPLTFVSGPSATSDIELERVEGVHGPRTLVILVVDP